jgi:hypothetical protein
VRGGKRAGAGRPSALSRKQALLVGEEYERLRLKTSEDQALKRRQKSSTARMVGSEQSRTELIPLSVRRQADISDITESIDEITVGRRSVSIPLKRAYSARATLVQETIVWCKAEYGQVITTSKVIECWKEYRRFQEWFENRRSLIPT